MALARQLTILELHLLSFVGPEEFIQSFIQTSLIKDANPNQRLHEKKTKNLEAYGKWFNRLNFLVASDILKVVSLNALGLSYLQNSYFLNRPLRPNRVHAF
jgi:hypothetical protein